MQTKLTIPSYPSVAGQRYPLGSIGKGDTRQRIENTTVEECREYASLLEANGFIKTQAREIPSGNLGVLNLFYEYANDTTSVFVFFDASIGTVFVTTEPFQETPSLGSNFEDKGVQPTFTQLSVTLGMCYIVQLKNGEFILVDGGASSERDEGLLYDFLKEKTLKEKPVIALWIFTHAHEDHINMAAGFLANYKERVEVKAFAYQFPCVEKVTVTMENLARSKEEIERLENSIATSYPKASLYTLHTGQSYSFAGLEMEILFTLDDTYPSVYKSFNDTSVAFRLRFESGKTVLLLGDCMLADCRRIAHTYGEYIKSDLLQVTHHGLIGGDKFLYEFVDPEICFWPTFEELFLGRYPRHRYRYTLGEGGCEGNAYLRDESIRKRTHYHAGKTVTVGV